MYRPINSCQGVSQGVSSYQNISRGILEGAGFVWSVQYSQQLGCEELSRGLSVCQDVLGGVRMCWFPVKMWQDMSHYI